VTELDRFVRRLRGLSPRVRPTRVRSDAARRLAADLVAVAGTGRLLPAVPDHALADVIAVVGADAYAADPEVTLQLLAAASRELS
jgi:hypothetical protein